MAIETECPSCGKGYRVKDELDGRKIRCKQCREPFTVQDLAAQEEEAWDDDYDDEQYSDDQFGSMSEPYGAPTRDSLPRRKSNQKGGRSRSSHNSASKPAWQLPVGILGIVVGVGLTGFGIWALMEGKRKAGRATYGGIFLTIAAARLAFGSNDDE